MTEPTPSAWKAVITGLIPSLNTCLVAIVTAVVSIGGTVVTQRLTAPLPPVPRIVEVVKTVPDTGSTAQRLITIEGKIDQFLATDSARKAKRKIVSAPPKAK